MSDDWTVAGVLWAVVVLLKLWAVHRNLLVAGECRLVCFANLCLARLWRQDGFSQRAAALEFFGSLGTS